MSSQENFKVQWVKIKSKKIVVDSHKETQRVIQEAQAIATRIEEEARKQAAEELSAARKMGFEEAFIELNDHLIEARKRRESVLAEVKQDLLKLSIEITGKIIERETGNDHKLLAEIIAVALRYTRQQEVLTIRVNPSNIEIIQSHIALIERAARAKSLDIIPDSRVDPIGCVIESESGTIDAQLSTQLKVLERAMLNRDALAKWK
jgi:type III secretion protein L